jgi:hypothetical protein
LESRKEKPTVPYPALASRGPVSRSLFSAFCASVLLALTGCAAPGDPTPPHPSVPEAVNDLAARQAGDGVVLTFTLPKRTVEKDPLSEPPAIEIFRTFAPAGAAPSTAGMPKAPLYTVPSALVDSYLTDDQVRFADPIKPEEIARHSAQQVVYVVRTRASKKKDSANSNPVAVRLYPPAEPIADLRAQVMQSAIELSWMPPARTSAGAPLAALAGYRVYRAEVEPGAEAAASANPAQARLQAPLALLGVTPSPSYRDAQFEFGRTYLYSVRSIVQYATDSIESSDSRLLVVTPRDTFPPAPPQGLVTVIVPATAQVSAHIELSWAISPEADVAGYNIYRTAPGSAAREKLNRELLLTPTFRDMSAQAGRSYSYSVSAVDRAGNESQPSVAVSAAVPESSEKTRP